MFAGDLRLFAKPGEKAAGALKSILALRCELPSIASGPRSNRAQQGEKHHRQRRLA